MAETNDPTDSQPDREPDLNLGFNFNNQIVMETTDEITTAHCTVPMLIRPSHEAGPSPYWCCAKLANPDLPHHALDGAVPS